jgi:hypothetical protein
MSEDGGVFTSLFLSIISFRKAAITQENGAQEARSARRGGVVPHV